MGRALAGKRGFRVQGLGYRECIGQEDAGSRALREHRANAPRQGQVAGLGLQGSQGVSGDFKFIDPNPESP